MPVFAAKTTDLTLSDVCVWVLLVLVGFLAASLMSTFWLRLAGAWVQVARFSFGRAFRAALLGNFIVMGFNFSLAFLMVSVNAYDKSELESVRHNLLYLFSPITFFYFTVGSVLTHATIFSNVFTGQDGGPLPFGKAALLALVYLAIGSVVATFAGALLYALLVLYRTGSL